MSDNHCFGPCSPFFIVSDIENSLAYYVDRLGFTCRFKSLDISACFSIVGRDSAQIMLKSISDNVEPLPNPQRHRWDAFIYLDNPIEFEAELHRSNSLQNQSTHVTDDGLEGFELTDPDGYVCFFGHPI
ncbi:MAG: VOC family protein [Granulosicoccus sp.]